MSPLTDEDRPSPSPSPRPAGLRERKKARTKAAIQRHAVRLFLEQGYDATTVEQVAEAAEVSPSTVFRYFPTKEDLVVTDDYDPMFAAAFAAQEPGLSAVQAMRAALRDTFAQLPPEDLATQRERTILVVSVPDLWGANLRNLTPTLRLIAGMAAERTGHEPDDPAVTAFAGAVFGIMLQTMLRWAEQPELDIVAEIDDALARLEDGLPL